MWAHMEHADLKTRQLLSRLRDDRSGRVVFVAHCLLNENVRYLGGACRPGDVSEVVDGLRRQGVGICQMPCPEQQVWGGVLKRRLLALYGSRRLGSRRVRRLVVVLLSAYTRWRYRRLAGTLVRQMADYRSSGFEVSGIVGVDASPSCGVRYTLDLGAALEALAMCDLASIDRATFNRDVVASTCIAGEGMFIEGLREELARRDQRERFFAHDLIAELGQRRIAPIELGCEGNDATGVGRANARSIRSTGRPDESRTRRRTRRPTAPLAASARGPLERRKE
jgi:predicted secreted protein